MDALIIKKPHIDNILSGIKTWEIRGSSTKKRGKIGLIESGSKTIVGEVELVDSIELTDELIRTNADKHLAKNITYKKPHAWVLKNAKRYETPIPYKHPLGAIIWVKLIEDILV